RCTRFHCVYRASPRLTEDHAGLAMTAGPLWRAQRNVPEEDVLPTRTQLDTDASLIGMLSVCPVGWGVWDGDRLPVSACPVRRLEGLLQLAPLGLAIPRPFH